MLCGLAHASQYPTERCVYMLRSRFIHTRFRYVFSGSDGLGYSVMDDGCFDNHSHTHEMAHNLGCYHDRDNSNTQHAYRHGWRYCTGDVQ